MKVRLILIFFIGLFSKTSFCQPAYPGKKIDTRDVILSEKEWLLENNVLRVTWQVDAPFVQSPELLNKETNHTIHWKDTAWFSIVLKNGKRLSSTDFILTSSPIIEKIEAQPESFKLSDKYDGEKISATFQNSLSGIKLQWEAILKTDANYIRQLFTFSANDTILIEKICLLELPRECNSQPSGTVFGSPIICNNVFLGIEHPLSQSDMIGGRLVSFMKNYKPLTTSDHLSFSVVWGIAPKGQLRRAFLYYLERERVLPYRQQLHYNSWYDLSWSNFKLNEPSCLSRIQTFADSLITKRNIPIDAFLFDDGWDNNKSLWQFTDSFPNGFDNLALLANKYNAGLGVWISPFGGYDPEKTERLEYGQKQYPPFETNASGFSLSGPVYYERFYTVAANFVKKYNVSMFKFDGIGSGNNTKEADEYQKDVEAFLNLIEDLRNLNPELFISLTVGTWASPYWLFYGDAIWRNGKDTHMIGVGSNRQKWITYRDAEVYKNVVKKGPLFPLNSLMLHGICIADNGTPAKFEMSDKDIFDEIWSFFASGTNMQELYINPDKLSKQQWDCLAEAIKWSKRNAKILSDVHWIGGNPENGEIYGWAAWSPKKAIVSLRNPSNETKIFSMNIEEILELPMGNNNDYQFYKVRNKQESEEILKEGSKLKIVLEPLQVIVFEGITKKEN